MKDFCRNSFLVDLGIDVVYSKQIAQLRIAYAFSEECYRFLLAKDNTLIGDCKEELYFLNLESNVATNNLIEVNEESIFSPYIFFFARRGRHQLIGEITVSPFMGYIVSLNEEQFCDIDSIEELLEEYDISVDTVLGDEEMLLRTLLSASRGIIAIASESFSDFLEE